MATAVLEAPQTDAVSPKRWTRQEYYRLIEEGFFDVGPRVELIDGEIVTMSPELQPHIQGMIKLRRVLGRLEGEGRHARMMSSISMGPDSSPSEPEPDGSLFAGNEEAYKSNPTTALLAIEVSDTSLKRDRTAKASLYARADIPEYWIVDVLHHTLEVRRDPGLMPGERYGVGYRSLTILRKGEVVRPLAVPNVEIAVSELFPRKSD